MQTKAASLFEAVVNLSVGYLLAVVVQRTVFPWFDLEVTIGDNFHIAGIFTGVGLIRTYLIRRFFNRR